MNLKLITIAIPTYNRLQSLKDCLSYLTPQVENYLEYVDLIISNNCSTDGTREYLEKLVEDKKYIRVYNKEENIGPDGNFISIFDLCDSKYVHILSDDDYLIEGSLDKIISILKDNDLSFLFLNYSMFYNKFNPENINKYYKHIKEDGGIITDDKKLFIEKVKLEFTFLSSLVYNKNNLKETSFYKQFLNTNWAQSFVAIDSMRGNKKLGICCFPVIAQNQLTKSPSFNPFYVFGPSLKKLINFSIEAGFDKKQMYKLFYKRCGTMYRSIGKYKIDKKPVFKDFKPMFKVTKHKLSFWIKLYPFLFVPRFMYKIMGKKYYKKKTLD